MGDYHNNGDCPVCKANLALNKAESELVVLRAENLALKSYSQKVAGDDR